MSRGVAAVFREAGRIHNATGERRLAAFLENLPTDEDRSRFLDAARAFLSFDWKIRNLTPGRRKALLHVPIENADQEANVVAALWLASDRLLRENPPGDGKSELDIQLFGTRLLMARLIVGGLQGASDRRALLDAALLLRELSESAQLIRSKNEGKSGRLDALSDENAERKRRSALLRGEAEKIRSERPTLRSKKDRADKLNKRFQKQGWKPWPSPDALVQFARRNGIKI